jgi:hypothetical protein
LDWQPKYVLVKFYVDSSLPSVGMLIFREGEVPFTSEIFRTTFFYRIICRSHDLEEVKKRAKLAFSAASG